MFWKGYLTDSKDYQAARNYWKVLKSRLNSEGNELVTKCNRFKMKAAAAYIRVSTGLAQQVLNFTIKLCIIILRKNQ